MKKTEAEELRESEDALWRETERRCNISIAETTRVDIIKNALSLSGVFDPEQLDSLKEGLNTCCSFFVLITNNPNRQPKSNTASLKRRSEKPLKKHLHLVNFVAARKKGKRFDWQRITIEWNDSHPYATMTLDELRNRYHGYKGQDKDMQREYAKEKHSQYAPQIDEFASHVPANSSLVNDQMWEALGKISLFEGETAVAGTVRFTDLVLHQANSTKVGRP